MATTADKQRLLNDPAFLEITESLESEIITALKDTQLNGSSDTNKYVLELVRLLQTSGRYKALLNVMIENGKVADELRQRRELQKGVA